MVLCLYAVHIGDSRVYRLRGRDVDHGLKARWGDDEVIERLTKDHTVAEDPERDYDDAIASPSELQLLTRVIGRGEGLRVTTRIEKIEPGDSLLLCTDGLHGVLWETQFQLPLRCARSLREAKDPQYRMALP